MEVSEGDRAPGKEGRRRGRDGNFPTTQYTEASGDSGRGKERTSRSGLAAPPSPQRGTAVGRDREVSTHRHPYGADSASPEHIALVCLECGLLLPEDPAGDPAVAEPQECGDNHEATMGKRGPDVR